MIFNIKLVLPFDSNNELPYETQTASSNIHMIKALCEDSRVTLLVISNTLFFSQIIFHESSFPSSCKSTGELKKSAGGKKRTRNSFLMKWKPRCSMMYSLYTLFAHLRL